MQLSQYRALHKQQLAKIGKLQRRGIDAAKRTAFRIVSDSIRKYRKGKFRPEQVMAEIKKLKPLLRDAMVACHLTGVDVQKSLSPVKLEVFDSTIKVLKNRLSTNVDKLINEYDFKALEVLEGCTDKVEGKLEGVIQKIVETGAHVKEGVDMLNTAFDDLGLTPDNSYTLENIFRTQTSLSFNAGKWEADQDPAIQEVLWGYVYVTVGDDRVRESHQELEGMTAPASHPIWRTAWPPNGWSCRCTCIPLYDEEDINIPASSILKEAVDPGFRYNAGELFT